MTAKLYTFNGKPMLLKDIQVLIPFLSDSGLRGHIAAGRNTTAAITQFNPKTPRRQVKRTAREQPHVSRKSSTF